MGIDFWVMGPGLCFSGAEKCGDGLMALAGLEVRVQDVGGFTGVTRP